MPRKSLIDETGNVYWRWTVIRSQKHRGRTMWLCRCVCGNEQCIPGTNLRKGWSKSCGCLTREVIAKSKTIDITGKRYGRLMVVRMIGTSSRRNRNTVWECKCDCGETIITQRINLVNGVTQSCGCFRRELISLPARESSFNRIVENMKRSAEKRGHEWKLSNDDVKEITQRNCFYCGSPPAQRNGHRKDHFPNGVYIYNGIDRVDNTLGYAIDNVVACCGTCNYAKGTKTIERFGNWVIMVCENFALKYNGGMEKSND